MPVAIVKLANVTFIGDHQRSYVGYPGKFCSWCHHCMILIAFVRLRVNPFLKATYDQHENSSSSLFLIFDVLANFVDPGAATETSQYFGRSITVRFSYAGKF